MDIGFHWPEELIVNGLKLVVVVAQPVNILKTTELYTLTPNMLSLAAV